MKVKWAITTDNHTPKDGETWHPAHDVPAAQLAIQHWIMENMPEFENAPYWRHIEGVNQTLINFGSHTVFALIVREGKQ